MDKTKYIDADKLKRNYDYARWDDESKKIFDEIIDLQPAADVVEVVRCKDCKYYRWEINMCDEPFSTAHNVVHEYDYCSKAERKTDG